MVDHLYGRRQLRVLFALPKCLRKVPLDDSIVKNRNSENELPGEKGILGGCLSPPVGKYSTESNGHIQTVWSLRDHTKRENYPIQVLLSSLRSIILFKMQLSFVSVAVAAVAAVATAAPTTVTARQQFTAGVTFTGVDGTTFGQAFPEDGQSYLISMFSLLCSRLRPSKEPCS